MGDDHAASERVTSFLFSKSSTRREASFSWAKGSRLGRCFIGFVASVLMSCRTKEVLPKSLSSLENTDWYSTNFFLISSFAPVPTEGSIPSSIDLKCAGISSSGIISVVLALAPKEFIGSKVSMFKTRLAEPIVVPGFNTTGVLLGLKILVITLPLVSWVRVRAPINLDLVDKLLAGEIIIGFLLLGLLIF